MANPKKQVTFWIRPLIFVVLLIGAAFFVVHGVKLYDIQEIITNASILCLS